MGDEEKPGIPNRFGLRTGPENFASSGPSEIGEQLPQVLLDAFRGVRAFVSGEAELVNGEKKLGVARDTNGQAHEYLLFDTETVDTQEARLVRDFIKLIAEKGNAGLKGSRFEWWFAEETDEFLQELVGILRERFVDTTDAKAPKTLQSQQLTGDKLLDAARSFREMAKRAQVKEALQAHFDTLPLRGFWGRTKSGEEVEVDTKDIDYVYVQGKTGKAELIVVCTNTDRYQQIVPVYYESSSEEVADGKFRRIPGTGEEKNVHADIDTGRDLSNYEFEVARGGASTDPLFTTVRILSKPVNLDEELRQLVEKEEVMRRKPIPPQVSGSSGAYQGTPPSVPSSVPRYTPRTTWVSSSG